jgi:hypothetical protein
MAEIETYARLARAGSVRHAWELVHRWYKAKHAGEDVHPCMARYMRRAQRRYATLNDTNRTRRLGKALGLIEPKKGSHGIREDAKQFAIETARGLRASGEKEERAVELAAQRTFEEFGFKISKRTIRESDTRPLDEIR